MTRAVARGALHPSVTRRNEAARARVHDLIGNVDIPEFGRALRLISLEQRLELADIGDRRPAQFEALGDRRKIGPAEH